MSDRVLALFQRKKYTVFGFTQLICLAVTPSFSVRRNTAALVPP